MSFIGNTILATLVAVVLLAVGLGHYDAARFEAAMHPLSESQLLSWTDIKNGRARAIVSPKIVTISGSSGLFGLRCAVFTRELGAPCVNGGLPVVLPLDSLLDFERGLLRPGDVVLMQLEYAMYFSPPAAAPQPSVAARLFHVDLHYLLTAVAEKPLASTGYSFFGEPSATPEGDRRGHARANVAQFADTRAKETFGLAAAHPGGAIAGATRDRLAAFFAWAKDSRILVVGTVQPSFDDWAIPESWLPAIRQLYADAGLSFVVPENQGRYPRDCFWDSSDRLNEECQSLHSKALADALAPVLKERGYAFPRDAGR